MSQAQDPRVTPDTGQFRCHECQNTEALRQQVHGVVHDFNNILEVIIGYSELLFMNTPDKFQLPNEIAEIRKAADQGTAHGYRQQPGRQDRARPGQAHAGRQ